MSRTVKPTFKQWFPGSGRSTGGVPVQGKTKTTGRVSVSAYQKGEPLAATDVGLSTIDHITLRVVEEISGDPTAPRREVGYSPSAGQFYLWTVDRAGSITQYVAGATEEVSFVAEGDSVMDVELL
jgi:hypothetical protein